MLATGARPAELVPKPLLEAVLARAPETGPYAFRAMGGAICQDFDRILRKTEIAKVDELGEKITAHSFRHTFGTMMAERGTQSAILRDLMRHADSRMTDRYTERAVATSAVIDISPFLAPREVKIEGK